MLHNQRLIADGAWPSAYTRPTASSHGASSKWLRMMHSDRKASRATTHVPTSYEFHVEFRSFFLSLITSGLYWQSDFPSFPIAGAPRLLTVSLPSSRYIAMPGLSSRARGGLTNMPADTNDFALGTCAICAHWSVNVDPKSSRLPPAFLVQKLVNPV